MPDLRAIRQQVLVRLTSSAAWAIINAIARTVRLEILNEEGTTARWSRREPTIIVIWHGRTLIPTWIYGRRHYLAMISLSRDGDMQDRIFRRFGWTTVRGSSGRGGVRALVGTLKQMKAGSTLAFTPDGPKGPSHRVHPGVLFLAQKAGCPIYPAAFSAFPRWHMSSWDRYQVPKPFSRAALIYGDPITVPADANPDDLRTLANNLAIRLCDLEAEAEARVTPGPLRMPSVPSLAPAEESDSQGPPDKGVQARTVTSEGDGE